MASIFWLDDALESALRLDGIVTLVDAKNILRQLERGPAEGLADGKSGASPRPDDEGEEQAQHERESRNEAAMQLAYADRVLVNKVSEYPIFPRLGINRTDAKKFQRYGAGASLIFVLLARFLPRRILLQTKSWMRSWTAYDRSTLWPKCGVPNAPRSTSPGCST